MPKVLITTCYRTTRVMYDFLTDFMEMLPNAHFYKRRVCQPRPQTPTACKICSITPVSHPCLWQHRPARQPLTAPKALCQLQA